MSEIIDQGLAELDKKVGWNKLLVLTRPGNETDERDRVLANPSHNPTFTYPDMGFSHRDVYIDISRLRGMVGDSMTGFERVINLGFLEQLELNNRYLEARDTTGLQEASADIFSRPEEEDVLWAEQRYRIELPNEDKPFTPEMVIKYLKKYNQMIVEYMKEFGQGLPGITRIYDITINPNRTGIFVREEDGKIEVPDRDVSGIKLASDSVHEIGTHAVQYEIGCKQPFPAFWLGFPARSFTSEGLALHNEEHVAPEYGPKIKKRAGNIMAMHMAVDNSFSDIYNELLGAGYKPKEAFKCAMSAKRGFSDTSRKGANFNRNLYVKGLKDVKAYLEGGGEEWVLYAGRINPVYADRIKKVEGLYKPPENLPEEIRNLAKSFLNPD